MTLGLRKTTGLLEEELEGASSEETVSEETAEEEEEEEDGVDEAEEELGTEDEGEEDGSEEGKEDSGEEEGIAEDTSETTGASVDSKLSPLLVSGVVISSVGSISEANAVVPNTEHANNTDRETTAILLIGLFTLRLINNAPSLWNSFPSTLKKRGLQYFTDKTPCVYKLILNLNLKGSYIIPQVIKGIQPITCEQFCNFIEILSFQWYNDHSHYEIICYARNKNFIRVFYPVADEKYIGG